MRPWFVLAALVLHLQIAYPCSISYTQGLWQKRPGAQSNLFAFEEGGLVGFIDSHGKVAIRAKFALFIDEVGDFSDGLARIGTRGFIDEKGNWAIRGDYA